MTAQLKIRDLELIVALHEEGTLTRAAKRVGITEPAFSKRLQLVEKEVQARLFERSHAGASATASGRSFVTHAEESVHAYHRAIYEAREAKRGEHQKLRIGASPYLPHTLIELLRSTELRVNRNLSIEIVTEYSQELLSQLQLRRIDLALVIAPPQVATVTTRCVAIDPFVIVFREGHPLASKKSTTLTEVSQYPWILLSRTVHRHVHDLILQRMVGEASQPNIVHHYIQAEQVIAFLTDDSVLAWMAPTDAERMVHRGLTCIPLLDERIRLETHLAAMADNKSPLVSEYARTFVKRMEDQRPPEQLSLPMG
jgi:DNA-binding transcriptional LysR family regulator